jgi:hypothetical protein
MLIRPIESGELGHNIYLTGLYGAGKSTAVRILSKWGIPSLNFYPRYVAGRMLWDEENGIDRMVISNGEFDELLKKRIIKNFYTMSRNGISWRMCCDVPSPYERDNILTVSVIGYNLMRPRDGRGKTVCFLVDKETAIKRIQNRPKADRDFLIEDMDRFLESFAGIAEQAAAWLAECVRKYRDKC